MSSCLVVHHVFRSGLPCSKSAAPGEIRSIDQSIARAREGRPIFADRFVYRAKAMIDRATARAAISNSRDNMTSERSRRFIGHLYGFTRQRFMGSLWFGLPRWHDCYRIARSSWSCGPSGSWRDKSARAFWEGRGETERSGEFGPLNRGSRYRVFGNASKDQGNFTCFPRGSSLTISPCVQWVREWQAGHVSAL